MNVRILRAAQLNGDTGGVILSALKKRSHGGLHAVLTEVLW